MSEAERRLAEMRAARDAARDRLARRLERAKDDLRPAVIKERVIADARHKAMELATEAIEIANDSRGVVVATGAALALWFARKPLGQAALSLYRQWTPEAGTVARSGDWLMERVAGLLRRDAEEN
ncbi:MAG: hypothetical protein KGM17_01990 [Sphingomonadales bacterium]|nr:hypothetical protein [Sphingomonadales bacterium]